MKFGDDAGKNQLMFLCWFLNPKSNPNPKQINPKYVFPNFVWIFAIFNIIIMKLGTLVMYLDFRQWIIYNMVSNVLSLTSAKNLGSSLGCWLWILVRWRKMQQCFKTELPPDRRVIHSVVYVVWWWNCSRRAPRAYQSRRTSTKINIPLFLLYCVHEITQLRWSLKDFQLRVTNPMVQNNRAVASYWASNPRSSGNTHTNIWIDGTLFNVSRRRLK